MGRTAMDCGDVQCTPLVFLTFLQQQSCSSAELRIELDSLARELKLTQDINGNGLGLNIHQEGELQTDGHFCSSSSILLEGLEPQAALAWPDNPADEEALRGVATGLIEIADQLERSVMAQAAENLTKKLQKYSIGLWKHHLALEVEWVKKQGLGPVLDYLPQEKVIMALTLTLVKGVCEHAPLLLRNLFSTAVQFINPAVAR
ncbi:BH3 interacting domain death agonist isoform X1 [Oncorhynchus nerka]|uniref:BH3 interacting domain death agonist isoform X1 n=1 Tax=Oncorhynchus nerka TaxID=8023 RepID=UPI0011316057|nr:BH3-interacting domain death agonist-like isoform X2 [Oncorhynchus nerka]